jgi:hypothetical protein
MLPCLRSTRCTGAAYGYVDWVQCTQQQRPHCSDLLPWEAGSGYRNLPAPPPPLHHVRALPSRNDSHPCRVAKATRYGTLNAATMATPGTMLPNTSAMVLAALHLAAHHMHPPHGTPTQPRPVGSAAGNAGIRARARVTTCLPPVRGGHRGDDRLFLRLGKGRTGHRHHAQAQRQGRLQPRRDAVGQGSPREVRL